MDGYTISDWMESKSDGSLDAARSLLEAGDNADKLYAGLFLLERNSIDLSAANHIFVTNCGTDETRRAWCKIAHYVSSGISIEDALNNEDELDVLITFFNLSPLVVRDADKDYLIDIIRYTVVRHPPLSADMNRVMLRIVAR